LPLFCDGLEQAATSSSFATQSKYPMLFPLLFYYILHILRIIKDKLANLQSKGARLVAIFALKVGDKELEHAVLRAPQIPLFCDGLEQAATTLFFLNQSVALVSIFYQDIEHVNGQQIYTVLNTIANKLDDYPPWMADKFQG